MSFIGVYARQDTAEAIRVVKEVYTVLDELGADVRIDVSLKPFINKDSIRFFDIRFQVPEKIVVVGGDGTLLRLLCIIGDRPSPIIHPIKVGRRGFFFELDVYQGIEKLRDFVKGHYFIEKLYRLRIADFSRTYAALNEVAVVAPGSKTVTIRVEVDGEPVYEHIEGDGIVVASPAGSTAYSLSAGGPILDRRVKAYVITPVNPTSWARPVVVDGSSILTLTLLRASRAPTMYIDGQVFRKMRRGDTIEVSFSQHPALLARYRRIKRISIPW